MERKKKKKVERGRKKKHSKVRNEREIWRIK